MNPAVILLALGGGALLLGRKKRVKAASVTFDASFGVNEEYEITLQRRAASFSARALDATKGIVEIVERSGDPVGTYRVVGRNPGIVEVSFYDNQDRTGRFATYIVEITN